MSAHCFTSLVILCGSLVQFQVGAQLTCSSANSSVIGVAFDSSLNETGDWHHSIILSKRGLQRGFTFDQTEVPWNVEVGYQPVFCNPESKESVNVKISFSVRRFRNPEYKFYPGLGYYKYNPARATWPDAREACEKEGGHLAIINSQQEADALKQLITTGDWAYLGLIKHDVKGEFVTLLGDAVSKTGYSKWFEGVNPANAPAKEVVILHKTTGTFSYDVQSTKHSSICELYL